MQILKPTDPIVVDQTSILIYGGPGTGKTSLGCSHTDALVLDFEEGTKRAYARECPVAIIKDWSKVANPAAQLPDCQCVVIDTTGKMLRKMGAYIIDRNTKMGRGQALNLMGWGELAVQFKAWVDAVKDSGRDLVFLAHAKESQTDEGITAVRPDISGSSLGLALEECDAVGLLANDTLHFAPRPDAATKGRLGNVPVPRDGDLSGFCAKLLQDVKDSLTSRAAAAQSEANKMAQILEKISKQDNLGELRAMYTHLTKPEVKITAANKRVIKKALTARSEGLLAQILEAISKEEDINKLRDFRANHPDVKITKPIQDALEARDAELSARVDANPPSAAPVDEGK